MGELESSWHTWFAHDAHKETVKISNGNIYFINARHCRLGREELKK